MNDELSGDLNSLFRDGRMLQSWKNAGVVPLPKQKPRNKINIHLRRISPTSIVSKVAGDFIVESFIKQAVIRKFDLNQFGVIPNSSTTHALVSMIHNWNKQSDGN